MSEWRTISVALQAQTAGYTQGLRGASDATKTFGKDVDQALGDGEQKVKSFSERASSAWATTKKWAGQLTGVAGGFTLIAGATRALTGGWRRLTTLQDATAALEVSLGSAAEAAQVMDDVLEVVTGTPYNLDAFAAAAQQMVGMGIEAQKVPTYLEAIGEAAATQGGRAGEYAERLTTTFGQVASSGQLSLRDVWSVSQTGVNALAILSNHFGVTREEMKKMVSQGAVPAGEALDALARGILHGSSGPAGATRALAGTMEKLRENMSGAVGGIGSAMDRLGAKLLEPFTPMIVAGANRFTDALDALGRGAGTAAEAAVDFVTKVGGPLADAFSNLWRLGGMAVEELKPFAEQLVLFAGTSAAATIGGVATGIGKIAEYAAGNEWAVRSVAVALGTIAGIKLGKGIVGLATTLAGIVTSLAAGTKDSFDNFRLGLMGLREQGAGASNALGGLVNTFKTTPALLGAAGGAVAVLGLAWADYQSKAQAAKKATQDLTAAVEASGDLGESFAEKLAATWAGTTGGFDTGALSMDSFRHFIEEAGYDLKTLHDALTGTNAEYNELIEALKDVPGGLAALDYMERWRNAFFATEDNVNRLKGALDDLGLSGDAAFNKLVEALWSVVSVTGMSREAFDAWIAAARGAAETDAAEAINDIDDAVRGGTPQLQAMSTAFQDMADSIDDSVGRLKAWSDLVDSILGIPKNWEDAQRDWQQAIRDTEKELKENGNTFDIHTEKGRKNHEMVSKLIDEAIRLSEAYGEQGSGAEDAANMLAFMRERIIQIVSATTKNREEAEKLVDSFGLTTDAIWFLTEAADAGEIRLDDLERVMQYLADKAGEAELKIDKTGEALIKLPSGKTITIDVLVRRQLVDEALAKIERESGKPLSHWLGDYRWGGIHRYATGGIHGRRTAQIGAGKNMIWWDEPETGGEAYIPRRGHSPRSLAVLSEAASWYGMGITPMAQGGVRAPEATRAPYRPIGMAPSTTRTTILNGDILLDGRSVPDETVTPDEVRRIVDDRLRGND